MASHRPAILRLVIFALTFIAFARLISCNFTWWDDPETIRRNPRLNPPTWNSLGYFWAHAGEHETMGLYVPVTYTVWSGLAVLAHRDQPDDEGYWLNAWVFHLANVLLHAAAAAIVFQLLLRLIGNDIAAALGALLFALHPVQVEPVGWISGTKDLLCGLLSISALLMYVRSVQLKPDDSHKRWPSRWRYLLGLLFFALAMLSKPTAVMVPFMAAAIGIFLLDRRLKQTIISLTPWFLLMIPCLIWTQKLQPAPWASPLPMWARPAVAADAIAFYFYKLVWPIHLCIDYGHNPAAIAANHLIYFTWIMPTAVLVLVAWRYKRHRPAVAAALLFILPLAPVLGFVPFEFQFFSTTADHYLYLPMVAIGLLAAWAIVRFHIPTWIVAVILLALGSRSVLQEPYWQDTRSLLQHTLAINPASTPSYDILGFITNQQARRLAKAGKTAEARPLFDESIAWYQKSLVCNPIYVPSMLNLALDYQAIGQTNLGLEQIHRMVQVQSQVPEGLQADPISMAHLLIDFGDLPGAIAWLDDELRRSPRDTEAVLLREQAMQRLHESPGK